MTARTIRLQSTQRRQSCDLNAWGDGIVAGFLYYVPSGTSAATEADLAAIGLGEILVAGTAHCPVTGGPDGGAGVVLAGESDGKQRVGYYPDRQTWRQAPGQSWWLGYVTDDKPTPADLQRADAVGGYVVTLEDGNGWTVPVARSMRGNGTLPAQLDLSSDGKLMRRPLARFEALCAGAERVWTYFNCVRDVLSGGGDVTESQDLESQTEQLWPVAIDALGVNYRVGVIEVVALGLLTDQNVVQVWQALIDLITLTEVDADMADAQKKTEPASTPDGSGS
jgi:hypothetical protein